MQLENNIYYEGEMKEGKKHGFGKLVNPEGTSYEGTF